MIITAKNDILTANLLPKQEHIVAAREEELLLKHQRLLIEQSIQGDADAFEELIAAYKSKIFSFALRLTGDYDEALDLSQDVLLKIYLKLNSFQFKSSLTTWIYRLTINTARNRYQWWRRRKRDKTISLESLPEMGRKTNLESPEGTLLKKELKEKIQRGISQLKLHYKNVLILRDVELLSYEEIAHVLQISPGTVKSRLSRARSCLKDYLKEYV